MMRTCTCLILLRAPKPNRQLRDLLHELQSYDMATVDFLHQENPPTFADVEPTTLGAEGIAAGKMVYRAKEKILFQLLKRSNLGMNQSPNLVAKVDVSGQIKKGLGDYLTAFETLRGIFPEKEYHPLAILEICLTVKEKVGGKELDN
ncbi:hypothetical protein TNCV_4079761 [Trichonephila clavipes]|nr:hypothetical protein TNCV_4079761 [Trichonephila clavipes]